MAIRLYGSWAYSCTQRALVTLLEKKVPFELVLVDLTKGEGKSTDHLKRHPLGKVPVLHDNGFLVYESRAICRYLAHKFAAQGENLVPAAQEHKALGLFEQAVSLEQSYFDAGAMGVAFEKEYTYFSGGTTDQAKLSEHLKNLHQILSIYDKILSKQRFIAMDKLTLADIFHLPSCHRVKVLGHGDIFDGYPNVKRWLGELEARESWKTVLAKQE